MANNSMSRRDRETEEMVSALRRHVGLLEDYTRKVYSEANADYAGELAGKLRLLATKFGSNKPLLIELMKRTEIEPLVTLGGPPLLREPGRPGPGDKITLTEYLELEAVGIRVESGEFVMLNKNQFIRAWAEQTGSSHEDWKMDHALSAILSSPIFIGGVQGALAELKVTTETVLHVAHRFLAELKGKVTNDA
jgi:hypothetical protein